MLRLPIAHARARRVETPPRYALNRRWSASIGTVLLGDRRASAELFAVAGGLYWVAAGIVLAILGAVANAWVLLVEILR